MCLELVILGTKKIQATPTNQGLEISNGHPRPSYMGLPLSGTHPGFFTSVVGRKSLGLG